jgi:hypothetical protein
MAQPILYINGEALDRGALPSITVERHNPLLSEGQQSYSYPFTLPRTARNERLLDFPARFERLGAAQQSFSCVLTVGHVRRVGRLHINSVTQAAYDASMSYDTALLLKDKGEVKLAELGWETRDFGSKDGLKRAVLDNLFYPTSPAIEGCVAFSVVVDAPDRKIGSIMNELRYNESYGISSYLFKPISYYKDGVEVDLDDPFGLAPFLRLDYALRFIFEVKLGYTLDLGRRAENPIARLAILHNRVDVVVDRMLRLKQLAPDCTVQELVSSVEGMLCGKFVLDSSRNIVRWIMWNDYLDRGYRPPNGADWLPLPDTHNGGLPVPYREELSPLLRAAPEVARRGARAVKLTMRRGMSSDGKTPLCNVSPPEDFFSENMEKEYPYSFGYDDIEAGKKADSVLRGALCVGRDTWYDILCSDTFGCYRAAPGNASLDVELPAEHLPMLNGDPVYGFGLAFVNSAPADGTSDGNVGTPLAFASYAYNWRSGMNRGFWQGSTVGIRADPDNTYDKGNALPLRLHRPDGLFNVFHALRDAMLRGGGYTITVQVEAGAPIDELGLYLLYGQPVMVERVTQTFGAQSAQEVVLQTVKEYGISRVVVRHVVTFDAQNGAPPVSVEVARGGTVAQPATPTLDGHEFAWWELNGGPYNFQTPVLSHLLLLGRWYNPDTDGEVDYGEGDYGDYGEGDYGEAATCTVRIILSSKFGGAAITEATVILSELDAGNEPTGVSYELVHSEQGTYTVSDIPQGKYGWRADAPGYLPTERIILVDRDMEISEQLEPGNPDGPSPEPGDDTEQQPDPGPEPEPTPDPGLATELEMVI